MVRVPSTTCPRCGAPRAPGPECPQCGVYYAKAEAHAVRKALAAEAKAAEAKAAEVKMEAEAPAFWPPPEPERPPHLPAETAKWEGATEEAQLELKIRVFAIPVALLFTWMLHSTGMGHMLLRMFLSMWIHESGHAVTAWLCGLTAFPGPWRTPIAETRSPIFALLLTAGFAALAWRGWKFRQRLPLIAGIALLCLQFVGTVAVGLTTAHAFVTFGGDGGLFVLGTILMTTLYVPRDSALHKGALRWGFLGIGAAAFTDGFTTWWAARNDFGAIPFGQIEGVGLSDPSKLTDVYGWTVNAMISRYVTLGVLCLVVLGMAYAVGVFRARAAVRA